MKSVIVEHKQYKHSLIVDVSDEFKLAAFLRWINVNSPSYAIVEMYGDKRVDYRVLEDGLIYTNFSDHPLHVRLVFKNHEICV